MGYPKEAYTTPKGNLRWAFVDGKGKENKKKPGEFKYQVVVSVPLAEAQEAIDYIDNFWKENRPKGSKANPKTKAYKYEEDADTGELTGMVFFGLSTKTTFPSGDKKVVKLFTAKAPVREVQLGGKSIGEESIGRGMGSLAIYEYDGFGTTLFLDAISLSKFVEYVGGVDASDVVTDDDAEDIGLGETVVGTDAVADDTPTEAPRV